MKTVKHTPGFLTWGEAAEEFEVSVRTLKRLASTKTITRYKQHGRTEILLSREELSKVLKPQPVPA